MPSQGRQPQYTRVKAVAGGYVFCLWSYSCTSYSVSFLPIKAPRPVKSQFVEANRIAFKSAREVWIESVMWLSTVQARAGQLCRWPCRRAAPTAASAPAWAAGDFPRAPPRTSAPRAATPATPTSRPARTHGSATAAAGGRPLAAWPWRRSAPAQRHLAARPRTTDEQGPARHATRRSSAIVEQLLPGLPRIVLDPSGCAPKAVNIRPLPKLPSLC